MVFLKKSLIILLCVSHVDMLELLIGDLMIIHQTFKLTKRMLLFVSEEQLTYESATTHKISETNSSFHVK